MPQSNGDKSFITDINRQAPLPRHCRKVHPCCGLLVSLMRRCQWVHRPLAVHNGRDASMQPPLPVGWLGALCCSMGGAVRRYREQESVHASCAAAWEGQCPSLQQEGCSTQFTSALKESARLCHVGTAHTCDLRGTLSLGCVRVMFVFCKDMARTHTCAMCRYNKLVGGQRSSDEAETEYYDTSDEGQDSQVPGGAGCLIAASGCLIAGAGCLIAASGGRPQLLRRVLFCAVLCAAPVLYHAPRAQAPFQASRAHVLTCSSVLYLERHVLKRHVLYQASHALRGAQHLECLTLMG